MEDPPVLPDRHVGTGSREGCPNLPPEEGAGRSTGGWGWIQLPEPCQEMGCSRPASAWCCLVDYPAPG